MTVIENVDTVNTHALAGLLYGLFNEAKQADPLDPLTYVSEQLTAFGVRYPGIYEDGDDDTDPGSEPLSPSELADLVPRPAPGLEPTVHGVPLSADPDEQSKSHLDAARKRLREQVRESLKSDAIVINLTPDSYGAILRNTEAHEKDAA